jgi:PAS domain S-box-containing protein
MSVAGKNRLEPGLVVSAVGTILVAAIWAGRDVTSNGTRESAYLWIVWLVACAMIAIALLSFRRFSRQESRVRVVEESEAGLRQLADAMPQLVWTARPDGTRDYLNQRWIQYAGIAPAQGDTPDWKRAVYPADIGAYEQAWRSALETGEAFDAEYRILRARDNSYRWHLMRAEPIRDAKGQITRWVGASTDIEDQKSAEYLLNSLNLELKEDVRDRIRQLEAFSYSVSHDLRAPLRAISGFAEILVKRHGTSLNPQGRHYLENIVDASRHMGALIDDLLDYSRLGHKAITLKPVDLHAVFSDVMLSFESKAAESGADIQVSDTLPVASGDHTLLTQIFTNLLDNALKYRRRNVAPIIRISCTSAESSVIVSVSDNGIGIAERNFERIFKVFDRLHSDDEFPGTGIGLAVVRRAIDLIGGTISVESQVGIGSTFHVRLAIRATDAGCDLPQLALAVSAERANP